MSEGSLTHVIGQAVTFEGRRRTRCSWCGALIEDLDLSRVMVQVLPGETASGPAEWPIGGLIRVDGGVSVLIGSPGDVMSIEDDAPDCCLLLDPAVTQ